jgi:DNA-binding XRE family transcriptional regulator
VHTSSHPPVPRAPLLTGLGQALRWLRERQSRKQYRVADDAGITKGMLSAYETGRQRPSLDTLDKLLETLGCDLNDLHNALQIVNGRPEQMKGWREAIPGVHPLGIPGIPGTPTLAANPANPAIAGHATMAASAPIPDNPSLAPGNSRSGAPARLPAERLPGTWTPGAQRQDWPVPESFDIHEPTHLYDVLGLDQLRQAPLAAEEEQALGQMLDGFHSLLRYWHRSLAAIGAIDSATALAGSAAVPASDAAAARSVPTGGGVTDAAGGPAAGSGPLAGGGPPSGSGTPAGRDAPAASGAPAGSGTGASPDRRQPDEATAAGPPATGRPSGSSGPRRRG